MSAARVGLLHRLEVHTMAALRDIGDGEKGTDYRKGVKRRLKKLMGP